MELYEIVHFSDQNVKWYARRRKEKRRVMAVAHGFRTFHWSTWRPFHQNPFICVFGLRTDSKVFYASINDKESLHLVTGSIPTTGSVSQDDYRLFEMLNLAPNQESTFFKHLATGKYVGFRFGQKTLSLVEEKFAVGWKLL